MIAKKRAYRIKKAWLKIVGPNQYSWLTGGQNHGQQSKSAIDVNIINPRVVRTRGLLTEKPVSNVWQKNKLLLN